MGTKTIDDLILAIQAAGVSRGRNGFRKDKGGEKLAETEELTNEARAESSSLELCHARRKKTEGQPTSSNIAPMVQMPCINTATLGKIQASLILLSLARALHKHGYTRQNSSELDSALACTCFRYAVYWM